MKTKGMESLPIHAKTAEIIAALREHQVVIVVGETGSGKTTQLPSLLYAEGFGNKGAIAITEPRRIAATSVARFVASEMGVTLGEEVGYKVRFDEKSSDRTLIKFMTDGMLPKELERYPNLSSYSVVMLDEAHERNQNIDLIFGLLKRLLIRRPELKVIISSATIDAEKFSCYFNDAPVIEVSGRLHPIKIVWEGDNYVNLNAGREDGETDEDDNVFESFGARRKPDPYKKLAKAVAKKVASIHQTEGPGDILVFLHDAHTINLTLTALEGRGLHDVVLLPAHGGLSPEEQEKIFLAYPGKRKVVVATNIAETSITIDGVGFVVDSGLVKETHFHPLSGIGSLDVVEHSQSGCNQRAGRAGRTRPGVCFRLYSEENFSARLLFTEPEIKRRGLSSLVLQMEALGITDVPNFDFLDSPEPNAFREAYEVLAALGAVEKGKKGLTPLGRALSDLPLDPTVGRMLLEAEKYGCVEDVATVVALLSTTKRVFIFPREEEKREEAERRHEQFKNPDSDALTLLSVWRAYEESGWSRAWCYENLLHSGALWEARNIRSQVLEILGKRGTEISKAANGEAVMKSVAAGLLYNLVWNSGRGFVFSPVLRKGITDGAFIHPGSALFKSSSEDWLVVNEMVRTTKLFMRGCSAVRPEWLPELLPQRFSWGEPEFMYVAGEECVSVRTPIVFMATSCFSSIPEKKVAGFKEEDILLADAKKIQEERIARAQREGWVLVKIERGGLLSRIARVGNEIYRVESLGELYPEEGSWYYCSLSEGGFLEHRRATPRFKVLDFDGAFERQQREKEQKRIRTEWEESRHSGPSFAPPDSHPYRTSRARTVVPTYPAEKPLPSVEEALAAFNKKHGVEKK